MTPDDKRLKHAKGIVNYYNGRIKSGDGTSDWLEMGLNSAQRYLDLVENDETTLEELQEFLGCLVNNRADSARKNYYRFEYWIRHKE